MVSKNIMKKDGFTLIELLAVIVVLGIIMVIAITSVSAVIRGSKEKAFKSSAMIIAKKNKRRSYSDR